MIFENIDYGSFDSYQKNVDSSVVPCDPKKVIEGASEYRRLWEYSRQKDYEEIVDEKYKEYLKNNNSWSYRLIDFFLCLFKIIDKEDSILTKEEFEELKRESLKNDTTLYGYSWYQRARDLIRMAKNCKEGNPIYLTAQDCKVVFKFGREE